MKKRGRRKISDVERDMNAMFSWSCFDGNFESLNERQRSELAESYSVVGKQLKKEFVEFAEHEKAEERLVSATGKRSNYDKKYFVIAGGSYSCRFILPSVYKFVRKEYPDLPIKLAMSEFRKEEDYPADVDIVLRATYPGQNALNIPGTFNTDCFLQDEAHLITSRATFEKYGRDTEAVFDNVPLIFARDFSDSTFSKQIESPPYYASFKDYIRKKTRLYVDTYFIAFEFMLGGEGILQGFSSMIDKGDVTFLTMEPLTKMKRYFVYNKDFDYTEKIVEKIMNNAKNFKFPIPMMEVDNEFV